MRISTYSNTSSPTDTPTTPRARKLAIVASKCELGRVNNFPLNLIELLRCSSLTLFLGIVLFGGTLLLTVTVAHAQLNMASVSAESTRDTGVRTLCTCRQWAACPT